MPLTACSGAEITESNDDVVKKLATRKSVSLTAGGSRLTILALRKANDTATVFVTTTDTKTKKTVRGMTRKFESFDLAIAALRKLEQDAAQKGCKKSTGSGGFKSKPDAFTTMPVAPKAIK